MAAEGASPQGRVAWVGRLAPLAEAPWLEAAPREASAAGAAAEGKRPDSRSSREAESRRLQLQRLGMERREEVRRLQRVDTELGGSMKLERTAQRRAAKQQQQLEDCRRKAAVREKKIAWLRNEIDICENQPHPCVELPSDISTDGKAAQVDVIHETSLSSHSSPRTVGEHRTSKCTDGRSPWSSPTTQLEMALIRNTQRTPPLVERAVSPAGSSRRALSPPMPGVGRPMMRDPRDAAEPCQLGLSVSSPSLITCATPQTRKSPVSCLKSTTASKPSAAALSQQKSPIRTPEEEESMRDCVRRELIRLVGGPREAFQKLDLNHSGGISLLEFSDAIATLSLNFTELTGLEKSQNLFRLFDADKDGVISFAELFPEEAAKKPELPESTEEFCSVWLSRNRDFRRPLPGPKWESSGPEEDLQMIIHASQVAAEAATRKKWMASTISRLKKRGKSDARCREVAALHLPLGTGPKDSQDVKTFSSGDVRSCRKKYTDEWSVPVKKIQKVIVNMRDIKRSVRTLRNQMHMLNEARKGRLDEERWSVLDGRRRSQAGQLLQTELSANGSDSSEEEASEDGLQSDAASGEDINRPAEDELMAYFRSCLAGSESPTQGSRSVCRSKTM